MIDQELYWLWAQHAFGEGSPRPWHIHSAYPGGLAAFYQAGPQAWCRLEYISGQQLDSLRDYDLKAARVRFQCASQMGWQVLTPEDEKYPPGLRNISDPPAVLYMLGELEGLLEAPWVAVVGARQASAASCQAARRIAGQLAAAGAVVVGGIAPGVDTAALEGAMEAFGRAVCVAPVDLASPYLNRPGRICRQVLERGGVLLSEYFSQRNPSQGGFHQRNRLITGMCAAVVLIQAAEKGGTMLYARLAARQGRPVYVYPGPPGDPAYAGSRKLLAKGALPLESGWELVQANPGWMGLPTQAAGIAELGAPRPAKGRGPGRGQGRLESGPTPPWRGLPQAESPWPAEGRFADSGIRREEAPRAPAVPAGAGTAQGADPEPAPPAPAGDGALLALLEEALTVEELSALSGVGTDALLARLAKLELLGRVERSQSGRYRRV